jgi:L,D-peptidoglycan transpeptidase YkuD (ErfK/YbiS/YcfS/YnhG family)
MNVYISMALSRVRSIAVFAFVAALAPLVSHGQQSSTTDLPWANAQQLVLVTTPDWEATRGTLRAFSRNGEAWEPVSGSVPVVIGRTGAAWGVGLHPPQPGIRKQEGDGRSPAGVFALGIAFGYANSAETGLPYEAMDANDYCIDVAASPLYNRIVDAAEVGADVVEGSTEPMRRDLHVDGDQRYKLGFVIQHNPGNEPGVGSCIFAHLWKSADVATAGCTAMAEPDMKKLLEWLTPKANPVFVLLPQPEYDALRVSWNLPTASE